MLNAKCKAGLKQSERQAKHLARPLGRWTYILFLFQRQRQKDEKLDSNNQKDQQDTGQDPWKGGLILISTFILSKFD